MDTTTRILSAIDNDPSAIRAFAGALARGDAGAIRSLLATRGVDLSSGEVESLFAVVRGGGGDRAYTCA